MANFGYDKSRFPNLSGESFDCIICSCVAREPKQCHGCGNLYCTNCIGDWLKKNKYICEKFSSCPNRCSSTVTPMSSKVLIKMYNDLDVRCSFENCKKIVKLLDLPKHEAVCQRAKCWNYQNCEGNDAAIKTQTFPCCSLNCALLKALVYRFNQSSSVAGDQKKMYEEIKKFFQSRNIDSLVKKESSSTSTIYTSTPNKGSVGVINFKWDASKAGQGIEITEGGMSVFLREQSYVFRTVIAEAVQSQFIQCFMSGVHYWEIIADNRTENELKIGVTTSKEFDLNSAFCDHAFGYAYYGLGQLRQNSNASGIQYGKRFKKEGTLGVCLNMNKGTLSFALNGESMGVAFTADALKKGPIYPAVSLLHCAGCKIRSGPIPAYFTQ